MTFDVLYLFLNGGLSAVHLICQRDFSISNVRLHPSPMHFLFSWSGNQTKQCLIPSRGVHHDTTHTTNQLDVQWSTGKDWCTRRVANCYPRPPASFQLIWGSFVAHLFVSPWTTHHAVINDTRRRNTNDFGIHLEQQLNTCVNLSCGQFQHPILCSTFVPRCPVFQ